MNIRFNPPIDGVIANVGSLFGLKGRDKDGNNANAIDVDEDGKTLFKEDIIQKVLDDLEKRKTERNDTMCTGINRIQTRRCILNTIDTVVTPSFSVTFPLATGAKEF